MADVVIDTTVAVATFRAFRSMVWKDANTGYQFLIDSSGEFLYQKTTNGGVSWNPTFIDTATTHVAFDVWYDRWTPGDGGNLIHITWFNTTGDDVHYRALDVSTDTLGTLRTVFNGSTALADIGAHCSVTKAIGGNLYVSFDIDNGNETGFYRSTDSGVNWSSRVSVVEAADDWSMLLPAANTGDTNDVLVIYEDISTDELTMKWYDDSANTITESSSIATVVENTTSGTGQYPFSASIRHSDGKIILAVVTERDTATADHRVFELNRTAGAFAITELTAITTDIDDHYHPAVFIDQTTDDIYVAYSGKRDGSEFLSTVNQASGSKVYYTKSTDDGATWSAGDTAYMEGATGGTTQTFAPLMGIRFFVSWRDGTDGLHCNAVNSISFDSDTLELEGTTVTCSAGTAAPVFSVAL